MLSHELRTPLIPALLATTAALMDPALSADHREAFEAVRRGVELEVRLIDDLLDIAKVASGKMSHQPAVVDPRDLVRRATEPCAPEAEAHGVDLDPPGHAVRADPARLQQVVWNLVKNAIKFTPEGGTVRVRVRTRAEAGWPSRSPTPASIAEAHSDSDRHQPRARPGRHLHPAPAPGDDRRPPGLARRALTPPGRWPAPASRSARPPAPGPPWTPPAAPSTSWSATSACPTAPAWTCCDAPGPAAPTPPWPPPASAPTTTTDAPPTPASTPS